MDDQNHNENLMESTKHISTSTSSPHFNWSQTTGSSSSNYPFSTSYEFNEDFDQMPSGMNDDAQSPLESSQFSLFYERSANDSDARSSTSSVQNNFNQPMAFVCCGLSVNCQFNLLV